MTTSHEQQNIRELPRLATVANAAKEFAMAGETPAAIRANIFKSKTRFTSKGTVLPGNGLHEAGAIVHRGRKILIDLDRYAAWLAGQASPISDNT